MLLLSSVTVLANSTRASLDVKLVELLCVSGLNLSQMRGKEGGRKRDRDRERESARSRERETENVNLIQVFL